MLLAKDDVVGDIRIVSWSMDLSYQILCGTVLGTGCTPLVPHIIQFRLDIRTSLAMRRAR